MQVHKGNVTAMPQAQPSETELLMALGTMHSLGRFASLDSRTNFDEAAAQDWNRSTEQLLADDPRKLTDPPKNYERMQIPGEDVNDLIAGPRSGRKLKGI